MKKTNGILSLALLLSALVACKQGAQKPPNVLFILVDDLGYADLGFSGSPFHETPHLDQLASQSFQFIHGYSGSRVCSPARASIMTGQFTASHGITDWIGAKTGTEWRTHQRHDPMLPAEYRHQLPADATTIAEAFKQNGYRTFFAGKWHLGGEGSYPEDHGFDANVAGWDKGSPAGGFFSPYNNPKIANGPDGENLTLRLGREVADFITNSQEQPFFAFLSFYAVHAPVQTNKDRWAKYREKAESMGIRDKGFEMGEKLPFRIVQDNPTYAGLVASVDDAVGIVLERLQSLGLDERTIVVFTSDNGGVVAGDAFATTNLLVKGGKGQHWEGGIRVPYLIKVPGKPAGEILNFPVVGADFFPTLVELAGLESDPAQEIEGLSLAPLLNGETPPERAIYWHYPHYGNQGGVPSAMIRRGDWKLIRYYEDGHEELYHIPDDPFETEELSQEHPAVHARLTALLSRYLEKKQVSLPVPDPEFDQALYNARLEEMEQVLLPRLEKQRLDFLRKDWEPNSDWWGSITTD